MMIAKKNKGAPTCLPFQLLWNLDDPHKPRSGDTKLVFISVSSTDTVTEHNIKQILVPKDTETVTCQGISETREG